MDSMNEGPGLESTPVSRIWQGAGEYLEEMIERAGFSIDEVSQGLFPDKASDHLEKLFRSSEGLAIDEIEDVIRFIGAERAEFWFRVVCLARGHVFPPEPVAAPAATMRALAEELEPVPACLERLVDYGVPPLGSSLPASSPPLLEHIRRLRLEDWDQANHLASDWVDDCAQRLESQRHLDLLMPELLAALLGYADVALANDDHLSAAFALALAFDCVGHTTTLRAELFLRAAQTLLQAAYPEIALAFLDSATVEAMVYGPDRLAVQVLVLIGHYSAEDGGPNVIGTLELAMDSVGCGRWGITVNHASVDDKESEDAELVLSLHRARHGWWRLPGR